MGDAELTALVERLRLQAEVGLFGTPPDHQHVGYAEAAQAITELRAQRDEAVTALRAVQCHEASNFWGADAEKSRRASWRGVMRKVKATLAKIGGASSPTQSETK